MSPPGGKDRLVPRFCASHPMLFTPPSPRCHPLRFPARLDQCWPVTDRSGLHRSHLSQTHSTVHVTCSPRLVLAHLRDRLNGHPGLSTLSAPCPSPTWPSPCCLKMDLTHNLKVWLCLEEENRHTWFAHDHK